MAVSHVKSNAMPDWTGVVTVGNSAGQTTTMNATDLVRPVDWNSAHNQFYTLSGNTNNASTVSGTNVVLEGMGNVTLRGSNQTIGISAAPPVTYKVFAPFDESELVLGQQGQSSLHFQPVRFPSLHYDRIALRIFRTNSSNSTGSATVSMDVGFYTRNGSTLSRLGSTSTSVGITFHGTVSSWSLHGGWRNMTIGGAATLTDGDYWVGVLSRTASGGANCSISQMCKSQYNAALYAGDYNVASNATAQLLLGQGVYSAATAALPASVAFSQIHGTGSNAYRPPSWYLLSQSV